MQYTCSRCGGKVTCANDAQTLRLVKKRDRRCPLCFTVIADDKYKKNIKGGITLFSPMDSMMGDRVVFESVLRWYKKENPDEKIKYLNHCDPVAMILKYNPVKFFWASTTNLLDCPKHKSIVRYNVAREASALALKGHYPALWFKPKKVDVKPFGRYVCLSARNIAKAGWKNAEPYIVNRLYMHFDKLVQAGVIDKVVVIGMDEPIDGVYEPTDEFVIDTRKKLKLEESAYILGKAMLTVGKDTGTMHLASAAGSPVIAWGYTEAEWKVKAAPGRAVCLMKEESRVARIVEEINKALGVEL